VPTFPINPLLRSLGGIYGHSSVSSSGVVPPVSHTQITYNNYYNNGSEAQPAAPVAPGAAPVAAPVTAAAAAPVSNPAPAAPAAASGNQEPNQSAPSNNQQLNQQQPQQNSPSPSGSIISDAELQKLTENLYSKDTNNAFKYITVKTQGQKTDDSTSDDAADK
jgi:poly(U)-specific endoribonuclease